MKKSSSRLLLTRSESVLSSVTYNSSSSDIKSQPKALMSIARLVPAAVIEYYLENKIGMIETPVVENFEAAALFADISGFSALGEELVNVSGDTVKSAEELSSYIGNSLDSMVKTVASYGGDVIKFAGDAILVVFRASRCNNELRKAVNCGLFVALKVLCLELNAGSTELSVHCGIGAGEVFGNHVGGLHNRWEYVVTGSSITQVGLAEPEAKPGQVVLSKEAYHMIKSDVVAQVLETGNAVVISQNETIQFKTEPPISERLQGLVTPSEIRALFEILCSYIPRPAVAAIESNKANSIAELRFCSIVFCRVQGVGFQDSNDLELLQTAFLSIQEVIYRYEGTLCRFIIDDKGPGVLFAFGLPPLMHENDSLRAVKASFEISKKLRGIPVNVSKLSLCASIGVTAGRVFCGTVGGSTRCEYTLHGTIVNLAARLMVAAKSGVLCSLETYNSTKSKVLYAPQERFSIKGKVGKVKAFRPISISNEFGLEQSITDLETLPGRENQLSELRDVISKLSNGDMHVGSILIEGEAGTGKSYCNKYAHRVAIEMQNINFIQTSCLDTEVSKPYFLWRSVLKQFAALHYAETIGQYLYFRSERSCAQVYSGSKENNFKFPVNFHQNIIEMGLPCFDALPADLKILVFRDMISDLDVAHRRRYYCLFPLFPEYFNKTTIGSSFNHDDTLDIGLISALLNFLFNQVKFSTIVGSLKTFSQSVHSILKSGSQSNLLNIGEKSQGETVKYTNLSKFSSVFGFGRKKHTQASSSLRMDSSDSAFQYNNTFKSETQINYFFCKEYLGGSKEAFISVFLRKSHCKKILLSIEDIEYADRLSIDLLLLLLKNNLHFLVMFTARSEVSLSNHVKGLFHELENSSSHYRISLKTLTHNDIREAVSIWLKGVVVSEEVVNLIYEKSSGHPSFAEELFRLLRAQGLLVVKNGSCELSEEAISRTVDIPNNISSLIVAKLDRLLSYELDVLKQLSVFRGEFTMAEAFSLLFAKKSEVSEHMQYSLICESLRNLNLLVESGEVVHFKSSMLRQCTYDLLLYQERKELHLIVAMNLYSKFETLVDVIVERLAYHFFLAEEYIIAYRNNHESKAIKFLEIYCKMCMEHQNYQQAYIYYSKLISIEAYSKNQNDEGLETEDSLLRRVNWHHEFARTALLIGNVKEATNHLHIELSILGFEFELPSRIWLYLFSLKKQQSSIDLIALLKWYLSSRKHKRTVLVAQALTTLAISLEPKSTALSNFCYYLAGIAVDQIKSLLVQNLVEDEGQAYDCTIAYASQFSLFNIKYFNRRLITSIESMKLALALRKKIKQEGVSLKLLLDSSEQAVLAGSLVDAQENLREARWTAKFVHVMNGIIDSYAQSILVALHRGRIVQAYCLAHTASSISFSVIFVQWTGVLAAECSFYGEAESMLFKICRSNSKDLNDDKLMSIVLNKRDVWAMYIFALLIFYRKNQAYKAFVVLREAIQILLKKPYLSSALVQLSFSLLKLYCELIPKLLNSKIISRRGVSSRRVSPLNSISSHFAERSIFKEASTLSSLLRKLRARTRRHVCFSTGWRYCYTLIKELLGSKNIAVSYSKTYHIAVRADHAYIGMLCCRKLYLLHKEKNGREEELDYLMRSFNFHLKQCEEFIADEDTNLKREIMIRERELEFC